MISRPSSTTKSALKSVRLSDDMMASAYLFLDGSTELGEYAR